MIESLVLGIVQGLTEFLPVSSSAHLILVPWLMGWDDPGLTFDVALHLGTLLAVLVYFRQDWFLMLKNFLSYGFKGRTTEQRLPSYIVLATVPGAVLGFLLEKRAESTFRSPLLISLTISMMGVALWWVDRTSKKDKTLGALNFKDALIVGLAQGLALIPGVSRSGITMLAGLKRGFDRPSAAKFSFLLAMPITAGACVFKLRHLTFNDLTPEFLVGVGASAVSGFLAIDGLIRFLQKKSYGVFAVYRVAVGVLIVILLFSGIKKPTALGGGLQNILLKMNAHTHLIHRRVGT